MIAFLTYEVKVGLALLVFYLFYRFLLKRETFHRFNRAVLVGTVVLAFLLPLCIITVHKPLEMPEEEVEMQVSAMPMAGTGVAEMTPSAPETSATQPWWRLVLPVLFWAGVVFVLVRLLVSILSLLRIVRTGTLVAQEDGCSILVAQGKIDPFSWMKYIVLSREDWESPHEAILSHEKAHIRMGHSIEVLLVDVLSALQWFNPAIWMLRSDLKEIHEFEADDAVLRCGADIKEYQYLLIKKAVSKSGYSVANSLNHSILKNRITMMSKSKSPLSRGWRALYLFPLVCIGLGLQARTVYVPADKDSEKMANVNPAGETDSLALALSRRRLSEVTIVRYGTPEDEAVEFFPLTPDTMPAFRGGSAEEFTKWVAERLVYSKNCTHSGSMEVSFVVSSDGSVRDVTVRKGICPELDAEAIRLISASPKWTPATLRGEPCAYSFIIPINFIRKDKEGSAQQTPQSAPRFQGEDVSGFYRWIALNLTYPEQAKKEKKEGRVVVSFVVSETGDVKEVQVLQGVHPVLDAEAVRVISSSPKWEPALLDGKAVSLTLVTPVIFKLR